jgi:hypothetical protein
LEQILRRDYPTLHAFKPATAVTVQGTYPVRDAGVVIDRYSLALTLPDNYPHDLPEVREIGGRIPNSIDRHVIPSGALCLGVREELWLTLGGNFSVSRVLDMPVRSFLIGNSLVEQGEPWPAGDRPHGVLGVLEFYEGHLGAKEPLALVKFLVALCQDKVRGHWPCPCGSGAILRKCHKGAVQSLRAVPEPVVANTAMMIFDWLKTKGTVTVRPSVA